MSRPARPNFSKSVSGDGSAFRRYRGYLPLEFADLVALQKQLAARENRVGTTGAEGDFASTLIESSALLAHALGQYQNLYAREAYLGTAQANRSLVRHARRLAYEPDNGLSATGYVVLTIGEELEGKVPEGLSLASAPRGEIKAQTYETLREVRVKEAWNESLPVEIDATLDFDGTTGLAMFELNGLNLGLGDQVDSLAILASENHSTRLAVTIVSVSELAGREVTQVEARLVDLLEKPAAAPNLRTTPFKLLAAPAERSHLFGWDANSFYFPPSDLLENGLYAVPAETSGNVGAANAVHGYSVMTEAGEDYTGAGEIADFHTDIYLSSALEADLTGDLVIATVGSGTPTAVEVTSQQQASVSFIRGEVIAIDSATVVNNLVSSTTDYKRIETVLSSTVTALRLEAGGSVSLLRSALSLQGPVYADWQTEYSLRSTKPDPANLGSTLELDADLTEFRPGDLLAFETLDGATAQVVKVLTVSDDNPDEHWAITWENETTLEGHTWTLDDLRIFGNVVPISHGETTEEVLGGSDGVTPFLKFELKKYPVTRLPAGDGSAPEIEVRVNEVAWVRVDDFHDSNPEDRHYQIETDEEQKVHVLFGNGRKGAIPASGKKHITAVYRVGLGEDANVGSRDITRVKKSHPLVGSAFNSTEVAGGTNPADLSDLRSEATIYIRTFDRAVSVADHADLARLYSGIARASARWSSEIGGVEVIAATRTGLLGDTLREELTNFLNARRDSQSPLRVIEPQQIDIFLNVTFEYDPANLAANVKSAVQDALFGDDEDVPGLFTLPGRQIGQPAHLSEVYALISKVEGVNFVDVTRFQSDGTQADQVMDVLLVTARQWLYLPPGQAMITAQKGATS